MVFSKFLQNKSDTHDNNQLIQILVTIGMSVHSSYRASPLLPRAIMVKSMTVLSLVFTSHLFVSIAEQPRDLLYEEDEKIIDEKSRTEEKQRRERRG